MITAQFYSDSDTFSEKRSFEELNRGLDELQEKTHRHEVEKSVGIPRMVYVNPALAEAKRRGIVLHELRPPLS